MQATSRQINTNINYIKCQCHYIFTALIKTNKNNRISGPRSYAYTFNKYSTQLQHSTR